MKRHRASSWMLVLATLVVATAQAQAQKPVQAGEAWQGQSVDVEGVAAIGSDFSRARRAAIGDALRQALASGGVDIEARTFVDRGIVRSDSVWATARGKITGFQVNDEWRDGGLLHIAVSATVAPLEAQSCLADPLPEMYLGYTVFDVDPAIDPAIAAPLLVHVDEAMRQAFAADPWDASTGPLPRPLSIIARSSERYAALAYGTAPGSGLYIKPFVKLVRRIVPGFGLVKGERMDASFGIELIDAAKGAVVGRVVRSKNWTLASRNWEYLPADYKPAKRPVAPGIGNMLADLIAETRTVMRCRPVQVAINGMAGDELILDGGSRAGLRVGDLLSVGEPTVAAGSGPEWVLAEVTSITDTGARARLFNPASGLIGAKTAVRLR